PGILLSSNVNCESIEVSPTTENVEFSVNCLESGTSFSVNLSGEGPVRAIITFSTTIDEGSPEDVYVNCASMVANGFSAPMERTASTNSAGIGGYVCASVFPPGGGDSISNVASSDALYQGDE